MKGNPLLFNPAQVSTKELEATFVAREGIRDRLLENLRADATTSSKRHWLVIGQRGSGKSHLVEVVSRQLVEDGWLVARLPEEHFKVRTLGDLFEQIAIAWGVDHKALQKVTDEERLALVALDEILRIRRETGRHGLVVVENLDVLIDRKLDRRGQHRLREVLMGAPPFLLLATATSRFHGMAREEAPFYDFFQTMELGDLSADEVSSLIERRARWHDDKELLDDLERVRERVHVIHHFSGGNPRVALALYSVLRNGPIDDLRAALHQLLDEVTPYYLARVNELSPQEQRVLAAVALAESPPTQAALARECRLSTSQVTAIIQRLEDAQMARRSERGAGRRVVETAGRLLRVWFQMRENPAERERLGWLTDFFRAWYQNPEEVRDAAREIGRSFWERLRQGDISCVRALDALPNLQDVLRAKDPVRAEWLACEALAEEPPEGVVDRLEPRIEDAEEGQKDALTYAFCRACDESGQPQRAVVMLGQRLAERPVRFWVWSEYRRLLRSFAGEQQALEELLQLAERPDADDLFLADVGVDAVDLGQAPRGELFIQRALSTLSCEHCLSEVIGRWITTAARRKLPESVKRAMKAGEKRLGRATYALLRLHRDVATKTPVSAKDVAEAAWRFSLADDRHMTSWIEPLLLRGVAADTAEKMVGVFQTLGAPSYAWLEFAILTVESDAQSFIKALDRVGEAKLSKGDVAKLLLLVAPMQRREELLSAESLKRCYGALRERGLCDPIPLMDELVRVLQDAEGTSASLARLDGPTRDALELLLAPPPTAS